MKNFPEKLRAAIEEAGLKREQAAERLETSLSTMEKWLNGRVEPHVLTMEGALARLRAARTAEQADAMRQAAATLEALAAELAPKD